MSLTSLRNSLEWALMVALVLGGGALAQAQSEKDGKIVRIGPAGAGEAAISVEDEEGTVEITPDGTAQAPQVELPKHWIGLLGGPVLPEVRAQIDVPEGQGLLVRQVVPDSPAAKAGLKDFDILLKAGGTALTDMRELMELVKSEGEKGGSITLEILRGGKHETITITPEARPENVAVTQPGTPEGGAGFGGPSGGSPQDMLRFFEQRLGGRPGGPMQFRAFGPGTVLQDNATSFNELPNNVSVSVQRKDGQPASITVERNGETWHIVGDDPGTLEQLPEELRPFVSQLLTGGGAMHMPLPEMPNVEVPHPPITPGHHDSQLQERLEAMEKHLEAMQQQLETQFKELHESHNGVTK